MSTTALGIPTRIGPRCNGMLMTREEFREHDNWVEGYRYELVHGVLIVHPRPGICERKPNDELAYWFLLYRDTHPLGKALDDTAPEHTLATKAGFRCADRVVWTGLGRLPDPDTDVPSIVIEFVSRRSRDRQRDYVEKRDEYLAVGVKEYWVIDRFRRHVTIFTATGELILPPERVYSTQSLPGFELNVARILEIADRYRHVRPSHRKSNRKRPNA